MSKTILILEDGKVVDTLSEAQFESLRGDGSGGFAAEVTDTPAMSGAAAGVSAEPVPGSSEAGAATGAAEAAASENAGVAPEPAPGEGVAAVTGDADASDSMPRVPVSPSAPRYAWRDAEPERAARDFREKVPSAVDPKKAVAVILGLILAATAGFGGGIAAVRTGGERYIAENGTAFTISPADTVGTTEAVAAKVIPSVVGITSRTKPVTYEGFPFFAPYEEQSPGGVGTGIIVDSTGYILTNSHVILDGNVDEISVLLPDGRELTGTALWNDRALDLAIVKVEASGLTAAELGDSDEIKIGAYAAAIGNPLGLNFRSSVSAGVVSGLDRTILATDLSGNNIQMEGLLQVDAAINRGNSGGPLLNSRGEVIGINSAKTQGIEGMGFAIPINTAKPIVESVKATGQFQRIYIGVTARSLSDMLEQNPDLDFNVRSGAYIENVNPGEPADVAGIRAGDIITKVDDKEIQTSSGLIKQLLNYKTGDTITVTIIRDGTRMEKELLLTGARTS